MNLQGQIEYIKNMCTAAQRDAYKEGQEPAAQIKAMDYAEMLLDVLGSLIRLQRIQELANATE